MHDRGNTLNKYAHPLDSHLTKSFDLYAPLMVLMNYTSRDRLINVGNEYGRVIIFSLSRSALLSLNIYSVLSRSLSKSGPENWGQYRNFRFGLF